MIRIPVASRALLLQAALLVLTAVPAVAQESRTLDLAGLDRPVEIRVDRWGISHI